MKAVRVTEEWQRAGVHYVRTQAMCLGFKIPLEGEFSDDTPAYMQEYGIRAKAPGMIQGISFVKTAVSDHGEINAEPASYIYGIGNLLL